MYYNVVDEDDDDVHDYCGGDLDDDGDGDDDDDDDDDDGDDDDNDGGDDDDADDVGDSDDGAHGGENPSAFYTFDFEMCFAPQRRPLFPHLNFQEWSENGVPGTFWLGNVLRATTASTFSTTYKSGPRMVCLVHFDLEMCFAPPRRATFHLTSGQMAPHLPL